MIRGVPRSLGLNAIGRLGAWLSVAVALCAGGAIAGIAHRHAIQRARYVDAKPFNGDFQTFDPVRRIAAGEVLFRDFDVYLGIGPTLVTGLATALCGGDFRASLYATTFLCVGLHGFVSYITARLCGLGRATAALAALVLVQLILLPESPCLPVWFSAWYRSIALDVALPANSILGIRAALAPVVVAVLATAWPWWQAPVRHADRRRAVVVGIGAGIGILWSNDAGIPFAATLVGMLAVAWAADRRLPALVVTTAMSIGVAACTALVLLAVITRGHPGEWFRYNFIGVAGDQFWYFPGDKVLTVADIPIGWPELAAAGCLLWLVIRHRAAADPAPPSLLVPLVGTALLAGLLSQIGGSIQSRYSRPTERLLMFVAPAVVSDVARVAWRRARRSIGAPAVIDPGRWSRRAGRLLSFAAAGGLGWVWWATLPAWRVAADRLPAHRPENTFHWTRPRGDFSNAFSKTAAAGATLLGEFTREAVPPRERIFSTYVSYLDIGGESFNPSRHDQIIHALGGARRAGYLKALENSNVRYAVTPRRDRLAAETWLRGVNWPVYESILRNFDPAFTTDHSVVWRRRVNRREWIGSPGPVEIVRRGPSRVALRFDVPAADRERIAGKALMLVEFTYSAATKPNAWSHGLLRQRLAVTDPDVRVGQRQRNLSWGLPLGAGRAAIAVDGDTEATTELVVDLEPLHLSRLEVGNATGTVLVPIDTIDDFPDELIWATSWSEGPVTRGIVGNSLILEDRHDARHLRVGDELVFSGSGRRRIVAIAANRIDVDGPPLDPGTDGFPHPVRVVLPRRREPPAGE